MKKYKYTFKQLEVKGKHIIFDADTFISLIAFDSEELVADLSKKSSTLCLIPEVRLELLRTNSSKQRSIRMSVLNKYDFLELPRKKDFDINSLKIQSSLSKYNVYPSPTDIYLGVSNLYYKNSLILTSNIQDFLHPVFDRVGHIILNGKRSVKTLTLLNINSDYLNNERFDS